MWNLFRQPALQKERRDPVSQQPLPFIPTAGSLSRACLLHGWQLWHGGEPTAMKREMSLFQCHPCHHPSPAHAASRALRLHHQPHTSMHHGQPLLTPSLPEKRLILPKKPGWATAAAAPARGASAGPAPERCSWISSPNPQGCCVFGEGGGDLEACPFKCCWRLFLGHWLKIKTRIPFFFFFCQKVHYPF